MPKKKGKVKKGKGKKGKGKKKGKTPSLGRSARPPGEASRQLLRAYTTLCKENGTTAVAQIVQDLRVKVEADQAVTKFILEPTERFSKSDFPPVLFCDWLQSVQEVSYEHIKEICVWAIPISDMDATNLSLCMETPTGQKNLKFLTLLDVGLTTYGLHRITRCLHFGNMISLTLGHNRFGDEGCETLCNNLRGNTKLHHLSLDFCDLTPKSGPVLGQFIINCALQELSLAGNRLQCDGVIQLVNPLVEFYESQQAHENMRKERIEEIKFRQEEREQELSAMGPLRAKMLLASEEGREEEYTETDPLLIPFPPLPPLKYLNIEDNAIDMHGKGGKFAPVVCMRLIRRWLEVSLVVTEIKLTGNLIGNAAGEEILTALEERQEGMKTHKAI